MTSVITTAIVLEPISMFETEMIKYISLGRKFKIYEDTGARIIHKINPDQIIDHRFIITIEHVL